LQQQQGGQKDELSEKHEERMFFFEKRTKKLFHARSAASPRRASHTQKPSAAGIHSKECLRRWYPGNGLSTRPSGWKFFASFFIVPTARLRHEKEALPSLA
jgi:hypothetical protein